MKYRIVIAKAVYDDYENMANHFAEFGTEKRFRQTLKSIEKAICNLSQNPEMYQIRPESYYSSKQIRAIPIEDYYVFYRVNHDRKEIEIGRIRSQKQDNRKLKFQ